MAGSGVVLNNSSLLNGDALQHKATRDLFNWIVEELKSIRKSLGAASGGAGAGLLAGSTTWNPGDLADGAGESKDVTVTGAALGDFAIASVGLDIAGATISAAVKAADTVTVRVQNESGSALNSVDFGTVRVLVIPARAASMAAMQLSTAVQSSPPAVG